MKHKTRLGVLAAVVALLAGVSLYLGREPAVPRAAEGRTGLAGAAVSTNAAVRVAASSVPAAATPVACAPLSPRGTKTVRIAADRTMTESLRQTLEGLGARIIAPVGARAVLVEATPAVVSGIARDSRFTATDVLPAAKVQKDLRGLCAGSPRETLPVVVIALATEDVPTVSAAIVAAGGELVKGPYAGAAFGARVTSEIVTALAARGDVRWIEHAPPARVMNDKTVLAGAANVDTLRTTHKLYGRGETVTVCDSGFDNGRTDKCHRDFTGRVKAVVAEAGCFGYAADSCGHGTHVSGTILGDGTRSDGKYRGMAPKAELVMESVGDESGGESLFFNWSYDEIFTYGIKNHASYIHSDSWGSSTNGVYNYDCNRLDYVLWNNPELLVVVSAGNSGSLGDGWISTPAAAKGALTVGNAQSSRDNSTTWGLPASPEHLNPTSSRGPTADGRIKPEITAPGTCVRSTRSSYSYEHTSPIAGNEYYTEMTGTSMACPLVAGAAALTREWLLSRRAYESNHRGKKPTGALLKAILTGGGVVMTGDYANYGDDASRQPLPQTRPNACTGWGRIDLENTLYPADGRAVLFADRIPYADKSVWMTNITTTAAAQLDVQLAWMDYPADDSVDCDPTLINDLDLIVSNKTTGAVWYGNGFETGDHTNTTESVRLEATDAPAGDYVVMVVGTAVSYPSTKGGAAAVYIRGAFPDETLADPLNVRNARTGECYEYLDEALEDVTSGDTLEVLQPIKLQNSVTLAASCTITATNAEALASCIACTGTVLTVSGEAVLTLSNIVFAAASGETPVVASAGAKIRLAGSVGLGIVRTEDAEGLEICGALEPIASGILVDFPTENALESVFGSFTCDYPTAGEAARKLVHARDSDLIGSAVSEDGTLVWRVATVPTEAGKCLVENEDGLKGYDTFAKALKAAAVKAGKIILQASATNEEAVSLSHDLTLDARNAATLSLQRRGSFVIPAGVSLVLTNIVVNGMEDEEAWLQNRAFTVTGGELTLEKGATLTNLTTAAFGFEGIGGPTFLTEGTLTMNAGSLIVDCRAIGNGKKGSYGGGVCAIGGTLRLLGGKITGCQAFKAGGGVYVRNDCVELTLGPSQNITGNLCSGEASNLHLMMPTTQYPLELTRPLDAGAKIGLTTPTTKAGQVFAQVASAFSAGGLSATVQAFSCDKNADLYAATNVTAGVTNLVWKAPDPETGECEPGEANDLVIYGADTEKPVTNYYAAIDAAFAHMTNDCTLVLKENEFFETDLTVGYAVRLVSLSDEEHSRATLSRTDECSIRISAGASLAVSNVVVSGLYEFWGVVFTGTCPLVEVTGGSLTLEADSVLQNASYGTGSWAASAVVVSGGGTFDMRAGSLVSECGNEWRGTEDDDGYVNQAYVGRGGGVLLLNSTAYLRGGAISGCFAAKGGALYAAQDSTIYLSGAFQAEDNHSYDEEEESWTVSNNLELDGSARLIVTDALSGRVGFTHGTLYADETNLVARAATDWNWDVASLTNSAMGFVRDDTRALGYAFWEFSRAATNALGEARFYWARAFADDGTCLDSTNGVWYAVAEYVTPPPPVVEDPIPPLPTNPTVEDVEEALETADFADEAVSEKILAAENPVEAYQAFKNWAGDVLPDGEEDVVASPHAWVSYEFGCTKLFENEPSVSFTQVEVSAGSQTKLSVSVFVKDGENAHEVASAKVAEMFEASDDLTTWTLGLTTVVDETESTASTVNFTVTPGSGTEPKAFLRLKW